MKIKVNEAGWQAFVTSSAMDQLAMDAAKKVAEAANQTVSSTDGFVAESSPGKERGRAVVVPNTFEAALETSRDPHLLIAALNAARGDLGTVGHIEMKLEPE